MLRLSRARFARTLHYVLNKFKLAGAHPDMIMAIDDSKASANGRALIELERLLNERPLKAKQNEYQSPSARQEVRTFRFWLRSPTNARSAPSARRDASPLDPHPDADRLRLSTVEITPASPDHVVKSQLTRLFTSAGVIDEFDLPEALPDDSLSSVLDQAARKHHDHAGLVASFVARGNLATGRLREYGVVVIVRDRGCSYLVTMPHDVIDPRAHDNAMRVNADVSHRGNNASADDTEVQKFLMQRGLEPFEFSMVGSPSATERVVQCLERLWKVYEVHRGTALRTGVTIVLDMQSNHAFLTSDGCISLPVTTPHSWETYLFGIEQPDWNRLVQQQRDWRNANAPLLLSRQRQCARIADAFAVHTVSPVAPPGGDNAWVETYLGEALRHETAIRSTVKKYNLARDGLRKRAVMVLHHPALPVVDGAAPPPAAGGKAGSDADSAPRTDYRITPDGKLHICAATMKPVNVLKVLREHGARIEAALIAYDRAQSDLEHLSRAFGVAIGVDKQWRDREPGALKCLTQFVDTLKAARTALSVKLAGRSGMKIMVSDHAHSTSSGIAVVPWNTTLGDLQAAMRIGR